MTAGSRAAASALIVVAPGRANHLVTGPSMPRHGGSRFSGMTGGSALPDSVRRPRPPNQETLARMGLDVHTIPIAHLPLCGAARHQRIQPPSKRDPPRPWSSSKAPTRSWKILQAPHVAVSRVAPSRGLALSLALALSTST